MPSLLSYLVQLNPNLDRRYYISGSNTIIARYSSIEGTRPWMEFSYQTIMSCLGNVLNQNYPPLQPHLRTIVDEASLDGCLSMFNLTIVNRALQLVEASILQQGFRLIRWGWASRSGVTEDNRYRPGFHNINPHAYQDLLPGDTKLGRVLFYLQKLG